MTFPTVFMAAALSFATCLAENWPQFRGPAGDGKSSEKNTPLTWSQSEGVRWKQDLPGEGHSSPVVWNDKIFLTTALEDGSRLLLRIDAGTGEIVWQAPVVKAARESMHRENSAASSTVATDGERVITSFQAGDKVDLRCFDFAGKELWNAQPLTFDGQHGYSYSPIFYRDLIIFDCRQDGEAATLALNKKTGQVVWRNTPGNARISHITPLIVHHDGRDQVIVCGSDETRSYNPLTGEENWWCQGPSDVAVAGLVYGDGLVFVTAGYPVRTRMAIGVDGRGNVTESKVAWKLTRQVTYVPSPIFHEGHVYTVVDDGLVYCFDGKTGEAKWEERIGGRFRSSLVYAGGKIYATNDKGKTTVFKASPARFEKLAENDLNEFCYATPAMSNGRMYIRTGQRLYAIESRAQ